MKTNLQLMYLVHFFLEWEISRTIVVKKIKTHFKFSNFPFSKIVPFMRKSGKILQSRTGHRSKYGVCAIHARLTRLQTNTCSLSTTTTVHERASKLRLYVHSLVNANPVLIRLRRVWAVFFHLLVTDVSISAHFHTFQKHRNRTKINAIPWNVKSPVNQKHRKHVTQTTWLFFRPVTWNCVVYKLNLLDFGFTSIRQLCVSVSVFQLLQLLNRNSATNQALPETHEVRPMAPVETFPAINLISKLQWVSTPPLPHTLPHMVIPV
jgi:hypothetical protein